MRHYRGGGRTRARTLHDFDREYGQPGERKGVEGKEGAGIETKDEFSGSIGRDGGSYKKMDFEEEDADKPENAAERLAYLRIRQREIFLRVSCLDTGLQQKFLQIIYFTEISLSN